MKDMIKIKKAIKKHIIQTKKNIIYQTIPNYSSDQNTGHQYNKNQVQFAPAVQQESRTDNFCWWFNRQVNE